MKKFIKQTNKYFSLSLFVALMLTSCTDLEVEPTDSLLDEGFTGIQTAEAASSQISAMYNDVYGYFGTQANLYALNEVTTDALLVPTRGSDWGDNGIWRQLHQHSWTPEHQYILAVWNEWNGLQLQASEVLDSRSASSSEAIGHASFLRALSMFIILDNFGQVPYRDTEAADPLADPEVFTGEDAITFILSDLDTAISNLPASSAGDDNFRATKAAARFLKAKVLLNRHIYNGSGSAAASDMTEVISLVDDIESDGYELAPDYFEIFVPGGDTETIWYAQTSAGARIFHTLHYNSTELGGGGWNGFSTLAEFYDLFEGDPNNNRGHNDGTLSDGQEERRGFVPTEGGVVYDGSYGTDDNGDGYVDGSNVGYGFLIGQQYAPDGSPLEDRNGNPLNFTRDFVSAVDGQPSLVDNSEVTGIRVIKYNPRDGAFANHIIFFRYSDAYLMKAEAMLRSGGDPTSMINELRTIRGAAPLGTVTEQDILDERARELYTEGWRRNDLIRFGQYTKDWDFKAEDAVGDPNRQLFPIPSAQLILNPNLVQNPGY
ncbi:MAG: RagB/SusD family nutrient uptake outer membrane protein [Muricauda sp.]|nr:MULTISPECIES: RagB/SusD family nutrient uptake outer membrane protein [unclassified Allomuricauda]MAU17423.1 RagB/SusD family nutrient uptake outer membrane protein [Allomuricauda sp.]|tara:strand:- start:6065 stop:7699 length:1635 start_codon:yes stop_codon:yes gene_type:complete